MREKPVGADDHIRPPADKTSLHLSTLAELVKFEHSVFALPYAYIATFYAARTLRRLPTLTELVCVTLAMVSARCLAFILNRAIDAEIDARNPRTAQRAIPAGRITRSQLWLFSAVMLAVYIGSVLPLPRLALYLSPLPLTCFLIYPYLKRFVPLAHYWLGLCLGLSPLGAWIAVGANPANPGPWLLGAGVLLWTAGFDIIYATQDVAYDRENKLHSLPADIGIAPALLQTRLCHLATIVLLWAAGLTLHAGLFWYVGTALAAALLLYENLLVRADDLTRVNTAFFTLNGLIAIILGIAALLDVLL